MRDPELNRRYAEAHSRAVESLASVLDRLYEGAGLDPTVPVRSLAEFFLGAVAGIALERAANPNALPDSDLAQLTLVRSACYEEGGDDDYHHRVGPLSR